MRRRTQEQLTREETFGCGFIAPLLPQDVEVPRSTRLASRQHRIVSQVTCPIEIKQDISSNGAVNHYNRYIQ